MLKLKSTIIASVTIIFSLVIFNSCSNEENSIIAENQVISDANFELLKNNALSTYNGIDFSKIVQPSINTTNYEGIIEVLNNTQNRNTNSNIVNFEDYEDILGEYYDEEYFNQLQGLFEYSVELVQSDLFNSNSSIEERQPYLEEILTYVILNDIAVNNVNTANRSSNCSAYYNSCTNQAERDHGIRIASCTGGAVILAIFTGGAGAATWPVCMATSGFLYDSAMTGCSDNYDICTGQ